MKEFSKIRTLNLIAFLVCCVLIVSAAYLQFSLGLEPCPLCVVQRFIVILLAITFFIGMLHKSTTSGLRVHGFFVTFFSAVGIYAAGRQIYLQWLPPDQLPPCAPNLSYILERLSWLDSLKFLMRGSADCAQVKWTLLNMSIPEWTLIFFILFAIFGLWELLSKNRGKRRD